MTVIDFHREVAADLPEEEKRRQARLMVEAEPDITGAELSRRFGKDDRGRWGRHQIDAVRKTAPAPPADQVPPGNGEAPAELPPASVDPPPPASPPAPVTVEAPREAAEPAPRQMPPARRGRLLEAGRLTVLLVAAALSYGHMVDVGKELGEPDWRAHLWPLSVDGLALVALVKVREDSRYWGAWVALMFAVGVSIAANVAAAEPTIGSQLYAAWVPLALLISEALGSRRQKEEA